MDDLFREMFKGSGEAILRKIPELRKELDTLEREVDGELTSCFLAMDFVKESMRELLEDISVFEKCAKVLDMRLDVAKQQLNKRY
jgi:hypothetical protein